MKAGEIGCRIRGALHQVCASMHPLVQHHTVAIGVEMVVCSLMQSGLDLTPSIQIRTLILWLWALRA